MQTIEFFRKRSDGARIPCSITLDEDRCVVRETTGVAEVPLPSDPLYRVAEWSVEGTKNLIDGSDELREEFFAEMRAAVDAACTGCERGAIIRKYRDLLLERGLL